MMGTNEDSQRRQYTTLAAVPCYNTEGSIQQVVSRAKKYVDKVIVVDDGSFDNTAKVAESAGAIVIRHRKNRGYGGAMISCFKAARTYNADVLVILDGDGQHNPDQIPLLLRPILNGEASMVIGSRFLGNQDSVPRYRRLGIKVITRLFNLGAGFKVTDAQSGFRAYSKRALDVISINGRDMGTSIEILIEARRKGLKVKEVPISCTYDASSHSMHPLVHGLGVILSMTKLSFRGGYHEDSSNLTFLPSTHWRYRTPR
jgi:glycosyltransferase involved in cell wall biosynthesis